MKKKLVETCPDVSIGLNHGVNLRLVISGRLYQDNKKRFIPLRLTNDAGNRLIAQQRQLQVQAEINADTFDSTLVKYLEWQREDKAKKYSSDGSLSLGKLWCNWCEYKKPVLAPSTYKQKFTGTYHRSLVEIGLDRAITPNTAMYVRQWLIDNRNKSDNINLLTQLEQATAKAINDGTHHGSNPWLGMSKALASTRNNIIDDRPISEIVGEFENRIYFTAMERNRILDVIGEAYPHYFLFTYFRFWTGCRFEESTGIEWRDLTDDCSVIVFRRTYSQIAKTTKTTKMGQFRRFNCPDHLIELLKIHKLNTYDGNPDTPVFTNQGYSGNGHTVGDRKHVSIDWYKHIWSKTIDRLYATGEIEVKLSPRHTRHTFSNLAELAGVDGNVITQQMGHTPTVRSKHYLDKAVANLQVIKI
jgi:integrase